MPSLQPHACCRASSRAAVVRCATAADVVVMRAPQEISHGLRTSNQCTGEAPAVAIHAAVADPIHGAEPADTTAAAAAAVTRLGRYKAADSATAGVTAGAMATTYETALPASLRQILSTGKMCEEEEAQQQETHLLRGNCPTSKRQVVTAVAAVGVAPLAAALRPTGQQQQVTVRELQRWRIKGKQSQAHAPGQRQQVYRWQQTTCISTPGAQQTRMRPQQQQKQPIQRQEPQRQLHHRKEFQRKRHHQQGNHAQAQPWLPVVLHVRQSGIVSSKKGLSRERTAPSLNSLASAELSCGAGAGGEVAACGARQRPSAENREQPRTAEGIGETLQTEANVNLQTAPTGLAEKTLAGAITGHAEAIRSQAAPAALERGLAVRSFRSCSAAVCGCSDARDAQAISSASASFVWRESLGCATASSAAPLRCRSDTFAALGATSTVQQVSVKHSEQQRPLLSQYHPVQLQEGSLASRRRRQQQQPHLASAKKNAEKDIGATGRVQSPSLTCALLRFCARASQWDSPADKAAMQYPQAGAGKSFKAFAGTAGSSATATQSAVAAPAAGKAAAVRIPPGAAGRTGGCTDTLCGMVKATTRASNHVVRACAGGSAVASSSSAGGTVAAASIEAPVAAGGTGTAGAWRRSAELTRRGNNRREGGTQKLWRRQLGGQGGSSTTRQCDTAITLPQAAFAEQEQAIRATATTGSVKKESCGVANWAREPKGGAAARAELTPDETRQAEIATASEEALTTAGKAAKVAVGEPATAAASRKERGAVLGTSDETGGSPNAGCHDRDDLGFRQESKVSVSSSCYLDRGDSLMRRDTQSTVGGGWSMKGTHSYSTFSSSLRLCSTSAAHSVEIGGWGCVAGGGGNFNCSCCRRSSSQYSVSMSPDASAPVSTVSPANSGPSPGGSRRSSSTRKTAKGWSCLAAFHVSLGSAAVPQLTDKEATGIPNGEEEEGLREHQQVTEVSEEEIPPRSKGAAAALASVAGHQAEATGSDGYPPVTERASPRRCAATSAALFSKADFAAGAGDAAALTTTGESLAAHAAEGGATCASKGIATQAANFVRRAVPAGKQAPADALEGAVAEKDDPPQAGGSCTEMTASVALNETRRHSGSLQTDCTEDSTWFGAVQEHQQGQRNLSSVASAVEEPAAASPLELVACSRLPQMAASDDAPFSAENTAAQRVSLVTKPATAAPSSEPTVAAAAAVPTVAATLRDADGATVAAANVGAAAAAAGRSEAADAVASPRRTIAVTACDGLLSSAKASVHVGVAAAAAAGWSSAPGVVNVAGGDEAAARAAASTRLRRCAAAHGRQSEPEKWQQQGQLRERPGSGGEQRSETVWVAAAQDHQMLPQSKKNYCGFTPLQVQQQQNKDGDEVGSLIPHGLSGLRVPQQLPEEMREYAAGSADWCWEPRGVFVPAVCGAAATQKNALPSLLESPQAMVGTMPARARQQRMEHLEERLYDVRLQETQKRPLKWQLGEGQQLQVRAFRSTQQASLQQSGELLQQRENPLQPEHQFQQHSQRICEAVNFSRPRSSSIDFTTSAVPDAAGTVRCSAVAGAGEQSPVEPRLPQKQEQTLEAKRLQQPCLQQQPLLGEQLREQRERQVPQEWGRSQGLQMDDERQLELEWQPQQQFQTSQHCEGDASVGELSVNLFDRRMEHVNVPQQLSQKEATQQQQTQHMSSQSLWQQDVHGQPTQLQDDVHPQLTGKHLEPLIVENNSVDSCCSDITPLTRKKLGTRWLRCALRYVWKLVCRVQAQQQRDRQQHGPHQDHPHQREYERLQQGKKKASTSSDVVTCRGSSLSGGTAAGGVVHTEEKHRKSDPVVERQPAAAVDARQAVNGICMPPTGGVVASGDVAAATEHRAAAVNTPPAADCPVPHAAAAADKNAFSTVALAGAHAAIPRVEGLPLARQQLLAAAAAVLPRLSAEVPAGAAALLYCSGNRPPEPVVSKRWQRRGDAQQDTLQQKMGIPAVTLSNEGGSISGNRLCGSSHAISSFSSLNSYNGSTDGTTADLGGGTVTSRYSSNYCKSTNSTTGGSNKKDFLDTSGRSGSSCINSGDTHTGSSAPGNSNNNNLLAEGGLTASAVATQRSVNWSSDNMSCALEDFLSRALPLLDYTKGAVAAVPVAASTVAAPSVAIAGHSAAAPPLSLIQEIQRCSTNNSDDSRHTSCSAGSSSSSSYYSGRSCSSGTTYSVGDGRSTGGSCYVERSESLRGSDTAPHSTLRTASLMHAAPRCPLMRNQMFQHCQVSSDQQGAAVLRETKRQNEAKLQHNARQPALQQEYVYDFESHPKTQRPQQRTCRHGLEEQQCPFTGLTADRSAPLALPRVPSDGLPRNVTACSAAADLTDGAPAATAAISTAQSGAARSWARGIPHLSLVETTRPATSLSVPAALRATSVLSLPGAEPADGPGVMAVVRPATICGAIAAVSRPTVVGGAVSFFRADAQKSAVVPPISLGACVAALVAAEPFQISSIRDALGVVALSGTAARAAVYAGGSSDLSPAVGGDCDQDRLLTVAWSIIGRVGRTVDKLFHMNASSQLFYCTRTCSNRYCYCNTDCRRRLLLQHSRKPLWRLQQVPPAGPGAQAADFAPAAAGGRGRSTPAASEMYVKGALAHANPRISAVTAATIDVAGARTTEASEDTAATGRTEANRGVHAVRTSAAFKAPLASTAAAGSHTSTEGSTQVVAYAESTAGRVTAASRGGDELMRIDTKEEQMHRENCASTADNRPTQANAGATAGDALTKTKADDAGSSGKTVASVLPTTSEGIRRGAISADVCEAARTTGGTERTGAGGEEAAAAATNEDGAICEALASRGKGRTPPGLKDVYDLFRLVPKLYRTHAPAFALLLHDSTLSSLFPLHPEEVAAFASLMLQQPKPVAALLHRWLAPQCCSCCQCCTCCCTCCCCCGSLRDVRLQQPAAGAPPGNLSRKHVHAQQIPQPQQPGLAVQNVQHVAQQIQEARSEESAPQQKTRKQGWQRGQQAQGPKRSDQQVETTHKKDYRVREGCTRQQESHSYPKCHDRFPVFDVPARRAAEHTCCTGMQRDAVTSRLEAAPAFTYVGAAEPTGSTTGAAPKEVTATAAETHSSKTLSEHVLLRQPSSAGRQQRQGTLESCGNTEGVQLSNTQQQIAASELCKSDEERGIQTLWAPNRVMQYATTKPSDSKTLPEPSRELQLQAELDKHQRRAQLKLPEWQRGQQQQAAVQWEGLERQYTQSQHAPGMDVENQVMQQQLLRRLSTLAGAQQPFQEQLVRQQQSLRHLPKPQHNGLQRIGDNHLQRSSCRFVAGGAQREGGMVQLRKKTCSSGEAGRNAVQEQDSKTSGRLCSEGSRIPHDEFPDSSPPYGGHPLSEICRTDSSSAPTAAAASLVTTAHCFANGAQAAHDSRRSDASFPVASNSACDASVQLVSTVQPAVPVAGKLEFSAAVAHSSENAAASPTAVAVCSHPLASTSADAAPSAAAYGHAGASRTEATLLLAAVPPLAGTAHTGAAVTQQVCNPAGEQQLAATAALYPALRAEKMSTGAGSSDSTGVLGAVSMMSIHEEKTRRAELAAGTASILEACRTGDNVTAEAGARLVVRRASRGTTKSAEFSCATQVAAKTSPHHADGVSGLFSSCVLNAPEKTRDAALVHHRCSTRLPDRPSAFSDLPLQKRSSDGGDGAGGRTPTWHECTAATVAATQNIGSACLARSSAPALRLHTTAEAATSVGVKLPADASSATVDTTQAADEEVRNFERQCENVLLLPFTGSTLDSGPRVSTGKGNRENLPQDSALPDGRRANYIEQLSCVAAAGLINSVGEGAAAYPRSPRSSLGFAPTSSPHPGVHSPSFDSASSASSVTSKHCPSPCKACPHALPHEGHILDKEAGLCTKSRSSGTSKENHGTTHLDTSSGNGSGNENCDSWSPESSGDTYNRSDGCSGRNKHRDGSGGGSSDKCSSRRAGGCTRSVVRVREHLDKGISCSHVAERCSSVGRRGAVDRSVHVNGGNDNSISSMCAASTPDKAEDPFLQQLCDMFVGTVGAPAVAVYVRRLQELSRLGAHESLMALLLLSRVMARHPYLPFCTWNAHRLLLAAFLIITKTVSDRFYNNGVWARFGGVKVTELNRLEKAFLILIDHRCFLSLEQFAAGFALLKRVRCVFPARLAEQRQHAGTASMLLRGCNNERQLWPGVSRLRVSQQPLHGGGKLPQQGPEQPQHRDQTRRQQQQPYSWASGGHFQEQESRTQKGGQCFSRSVSGNNTAGVEEVGTEACDNRDGAGCFEGIPICAGAAFVSARSAAGGTGCTADSTCEEAEAAQQHALRGAPIRTNPPANRGTPSDEEIVRIFTLGNGNRSGRRGTSTGDGGAPQTIQEAMVGDGVEHHRRSGDKRDLESRSNNCLPHSSMLLLKKTSTHCSERGSVLSQSSNTATLRNSNDVACGADSKSPQHNSSNVIVTSGSKCNGNVLCTDRTNGMSAKNSNALKTYGAASTLSCLSIDYKNSGCGNQGCRRCGEPLDGWSGLAEDDEPDVAEKQAANPEAYRHLLLLRRVPFSVLLQQHNELRQHRLKRKQQRAHKKQRYQEEKNTSEFSSGRMNTTFEAAEEGRPGATARAGKQRGTYPPAGELVAAEHSANCSPWSSLRISREKARRCTTKPEKAEGETGSMKVTEDQDIESSQSPTDWSASESSLSFSESDSEDEISVDPVVEGPTGERKSKLHEGDSSKGSSGRPQIEAWLDLVGNPFANLIFCLYPTLQKAMRHLDEVGHRSYRTRM